MKMEDVVWEVTEPIFTSRLHDTDDGLSQYTHTLFLYIGDIEVGQAPFDHKPDGAEVARVSVKMSLEVLENTQTRLQYLHDLDEQGSDFSQYEEMFEAHDED